MPARAKPAKPAKAQDKPGKVAVRTPNVPGYTHRVDAAKYAAMKQALLKVMPRKDPGLTQAETADAVRSVAPKELFPGTTLNWWAKCVQLDLEARGELVRDGGKPLRWRRA
jgi:hypothetical protein